MKNTKRAGIITASATTLIVGGVAFAAWTSTGTGTGAVGSGTDTNLTVSAAEVSGLYPTGSVVQTVDVKNNNEYKVVLKSLTATPSTAADTCKVTAVVGTIPAAAFAKNASAQVPVTVSMANEASNDCKSQTFVINYAASADSSN